MKTALIISVSALALVACSNETATESDDIQITQVDETTASSALEALHLANSGDGAVSWDSRTFDDGTYTFTGLTFTFPDDSDDMEDAGEDGTKSQDTDDTGFMDDENGGGGNNTLTAATMTLAGPRFDEAGNVIFDRLSIDDILVGANDEDFDGTLDRFVIEQPNAAMASAVALGFSGESDIDVEMDQDNWTYGLFAVEGLNVSGSEDGNTFAVSLGRLAIDDLAEYTIGRFELMNFVIEGTDDEIGIIDFRLEEMSADGIGQAVTYPFVAQFAMMNAVLSDETPNDDVDDIPEMPEDFDPLDAYENATIRGLSANVGGITVQLDSLTANVEDDGNEVRYVSEMTPLIIAPDTDYALGAQMAMGLGMLNYSQLEFVSEGTSVYERDTDRAYTDGENYFAMTDGFRVEIESDMTGLMAYSLAAMELGYTMDEPSSEQIMSLLEPLVLNSFVFRLEDQSLMDRALTAASAMQGMSKEQLRNQAGAMIALGTMGAPAEIPRPLLTEFSTAMTDFIANGGSVEIRMTPDTPVSVADLVAQAEAGNLDYEAMGISITAIPPEGEE
ncbi:hypothetical protein [Hyphobacterium sp.]|uniref:hypothetical protein n=1 Tax=Hyphobacterium sp. TaxID=2004662 RepID=UPI00374918B6